MAGIGDDGIDDDPPALRLPPVALRNTALLAFFLRRNDVHGDIFEQTMCSWALNNMLMSRWPASKEIACAVLPF